MRARPNDEVTGKFHQFKEESNEKLQKVMNDPTLESKNENEVGRPTETGARSKNDVVI